MELSVVDNGEQKSVDGVTYFELGTDDVYVEFGNGVNATFEELYGGTA